MKRFLAIFLILTCVMAGFTPAFAENTAVHDILTQPAEGAGETTQPWDPMVDVPADDPTLGVEPMTADGKYTTMAALYQAWGGYEGYPDYVCGVWTETGDMSRLTVAVTDDAAGEAGKQQILSQLESPDSVTFVSYPYSYAQLQAVMDEIVSQMGGGSPIVACGIYEMENAVHVTIQKDHEDADLLAGEIADAYGDKVQVELGDMIFDLTGDILTTDPATEELTTEVLTAAPKKQSLLPLVLLLAVLAVCGGLLAKKLPARVTSTGRVVTDDKPTRAQTIEAVRAGEETPPDRVQDAIEKQL